MKHSYPPFGIKVICLVLMLLALLNVVQIVDVVTSVALTTQVLVPVGIIAALTVGYVVVSVGLWKQESWAWVGGIVLIVGGLVATLVQRPIAIPTALLMSSIGIYLIVRRDLFRADGTESETNG